MKSYALVLLVLASSAFAETHIAEIGCYEVLGTISKVSGNRLELLAEPKTRSQATLQIVLDRTDSALRAQMPIRARVFASQIGPAQKVPLVANFLDINLNYIGTPQSNWRWIGARKNGRCRIQR